MNFLKSIFIALFKSYGHKYVKREWKNDHWQYWYRDPVTGKLTTENPNKRKPPKQKKIDYTGTGSLFENAVKEKPKQEKLVLEQGSVVHKEPKKNKAPDTQIDLITPKQENIRITEDSLKFKYPQKEPEVQTPGFKNEDERILYTNDPYTRDKILSRPRTIFKNDIIEKELGFYRKPLSQGENVDVAYNKYRIYKKGKILSVNEDGTYQVETTTYKPNPIKLSVDEAKKLGIDSRYDMIISSINNYYYGDVSKVKEIIYYGKKDIKEIEKKVETLERKDLYNDEDLLRLYNAKKRGNNKYDVSSKIDQYSKPIITVKLPEIGVLSKPQWSKIVSTIDKKHGDGYTFKGEMYLAGKSVQTEPGRYVVSYGNLSDTEDKSHVEVHKINVYGQLEKVYEKDFQYSPNWAEDVSDFIVEHYENSSEIEFPNEYEYRKNTGENLSGVTGELTKKESQGYSSKRHEILSILAEAKDVKIFNKNGKLSIGFPYIDYYSLQSVKKYQQGSLEYSYILRIFKNTLPKWDIFKPSNENKSFNLPDTFREKVSNAKFKLYPSTHRNPKEYQFMKSGIFKIVKAFGKKDTSKLVRKQITDKRGKRKTVWVKPEDIKEEPKKKKKVQFSLFKNMANFFKTKEPEKKIKEVYQEVNAKEEKVDLKSFGKILDEYISKKDLVASYFEKQKKELPAPEKEKKEKKAPSPGKEKDKTVKETVQKKARKERMIPGTNIPVSLGKKLHEKLGKLEPAKEEDNFYTMPEGKGKKVTPEKDNFETMPEVESGDSGFSPFRDVTFGNYPKDMPKEDRLKLFDLSDKIAKYDIRIAELERRSPPSGLKTSNQIKEWKKRINENIKSLKEKRMPLKKQGQELKKQFTAKKAVSDIKKKNVERAVHDKKLKDKADFPKKVLEAEEQRAKTDIVKNSDTLKTVEAGSLKTKAQYTSEANFDRPIIEGIKQNILKTGYNPSFPMTIDEEGFVVDGHHRYTAVKELVKEGKIPPSTPVHVVQRIYKDEGERLMDQVSANNNRRDVNPLDEGKAFAELYKNWNNSIDEIALRNGKTPDKVRNQIYLTNLIPDLQDLINADFMSSRRRVDKDEVIKEKRESIRMTDAYVIGRLGVNEDGSPNSTLQLKAFQYAQSNKPSPSQLADYIRMIQSQSFSFKGVDESGRSKAEQEAMKLVGDETKAHVQSSKAESFIKNSQKVFSDLFGSSTGELDPKLLKEMTASVMATKGEGKAKNLHDHIDQLVKTLMQAKDHIARNLREIQDNSTMDDMFAMAKSGIAPVNKYRKLRKAQYEV